MNRKSILILYTLGAIAAGVLWESALVSARPGNQRTPGVIGRLSEPSAMAK